MPRYRIAHLNDQGTGTDMIIAPLAQRFGELAADQQRAEIEQLQARAKRANLAGVVVAVWEVADGFRFIAPAPLHPFLEKISFQWVMNNLNREISW